MMRMARMRVGSSDPTDERRREDVVVRVPRTIFTFVGSGDPQVPLVAACGWWGVEEVSVENTDPKEEDGAQ